jgi:hypothetical protein
MRALLAPRRPGHPSSAQAGEGGGDRVGIIAALSGPGVARGIVVGHLPNLHVG